MGKEIPGQSLSGYGQLLSTQETGRSVPERQAPEQCQCPGLFVRGTEVFHWFGRALGCGLRSATSG